MARRRNVRFTHKRPAPSPTALTLQNQGLDSLLVPSLLGPEVLRPGSGERMRFAIPRRNESSGTPHTEKRPFVCAFHVCFHASSAVGSAGALCNKRSRKRTGETQAPNPPRSQHRARGQADAGEMDQESGCPLLVVCLWASPFHSLGPILPKYPRKGREQAGSKMPPFLPPLLLYSGSSIPVSRYLHYWHHHASPTLLSLNPQGTPQAELADHSSCPYSHR